MAGALPVPFVFDRRSGAAALLPADAEGRYAGDENYGPFSRSTEPRQGAGVTGYGYLLDLGGGNDTYRTLRRGQGFVKLSRRPYLAHAFAAATRGGFK